VRFRTNPVAPVVPPLRLDAVKSVPHLKDCCAGYLFQSNKSTSRWSKRRQENKWPTSRIWLSSSIA
jgi:hypothetical protein